MEGDILHYLDKDAAEAEHQHGTELGIAADPDDDLEPGIDHFFHIDSLDAGTRHLLEDANHHQVETVAHPLGVGEIELDPAHIAFVNDIR